MSIFDPINLSSAMRSITKINEPTTLTLNLTSPAYSDTMNITFPISQIIGITNNSCTVQAGGVALDCKFDSTSNSIITTSTPGTNLYTINGFKNQKTYNSLTATDLIIAQIGGQYTRATTTPSTSNPITPQLTLGSIQLSSTSSSSSTRF